MGNIQDGVSPNPKYVHSLPRGIIVAIMQACKTGGELASNESGSIEKLGDTLNL